MAKVKPGPRERMIVSTALLVRERGAMRRVWTPSSSTAVRLVAPCTTTFPGGREQLLREATDYAGEYVARRLEREAAGGSAGRTATLGPLESIRREIRARVEAELAAA
jgi:hypothetical protein